MSDLVFGKYEIQHRLAIGGMGEVFYALQRGVPGFERPVILKSLLPDLAAQEGFIDQFLDEARVAATLNHPNVVSIFEVGQWSGTYYLAMEYIRGRNLAQVIRRALEGQRRVPPAVAMRIIREAALGLDHAHRASDANGQPLHIVHRDISPQNVMVRDDGLTKVVDFGIARATNRATRTATGALKGKLAYMAPEQILGGDVGPRADQFALGVVLWELLTQRRLFRAERDIDVVKKVLEEPILAPSTEVELPIEVEAVVMRMLERNANKRFASCAEVAAALERILQSGGDDTTPGDFMRELGTEDLVVKVKATPSQEGNFVIELKPPNARPAQVSVGTRTPIAGVQGSGRSPRLIPLAAGGLVVGAVLAGVAIAVWQPRTAPTPVVPAEPVVAVDPLPGDAGAPAPVLETPKGPARLSIVTEPAKATLRVDGRLLEGETPQEVELTPDVEHYLQVEKRGFRRLEQTVTAAADERRELVLKLLPLEARGPVAPPPPTPEPGFGGLKVNTVPWSKVSIDGEPYGTIPVVVKKLAAGKHTLELVNEPENIAVKRVIDIKAGEILKIDERLQ